VVRRLAEEGREPCLAVLPVRLAARRRQLWVV